MAVSFLETEISKFGTKGPMDLSGCHLARHCEKRREAELMKSVSPRVWGQRVVATVAGALVGFGLTFLLYSWLNPILEARTDWFRELQGMLFTMVPLCTVAGAAVGWAGSRPKHRTPAGVG